jgi:hypothetical protein
MPTPPKPELLEAQKRLIRNLLLLEYELSEYRKALEQPIDIDNRDNPSVNLWPKRQESVDTAIENFASSSKLVLAQFLSATHHRSFWNYKRRGSERDHAIKHTFDETYLQPEEFDHQPDQAATDNTNEGSN